MRIIFGIIPNKFKIKIKNKKAVRYICKNKNGLSIILSLINGKLLSKSKYDQLIKHNYSENFNYKAGLHNVGSYQVSGIPYVTGGLTAPTGSGTPIAVNFPSVTQRFWIHNGDTSNDLRVV